MAKLVQAKIDGKKIVPIRQPKPTKPNDLLVALRLSSGVGGDTKGKTTAKSWSSAKATKKTASKKTASKKPARKTAKKAA